MEDISK